MGKSENAFTFKSFNQLLSELEVKSRNIVNLHEQTYFRQKLMKLYDLDLTETFIDLFHDIEPKTRSVHLLVKNFDFILSKLYLIAENNQSFLDLFSALFMDFSIESMASAKQFIDATQNVLEFRDPEILKKLFQCFVILVKNFIAAKQPFECFNLFSFLLNSDKDYIRHFGSQLMGLLLRTCSNEEFQILIHLFADSNTTNLHYETTALLGFHSMMNINQKFYSNTFERLCLLFQNSKKLNSSTFMCLGYLLCKFSNEKQCIKLVNSLILSLEVKISNNFCCFLNCFIRLQSPEFNHIELLNKICDSSDIPSHEDGYKKLVVELLKNDDIVKPNFASLKKLFRAGQVDDYAFICSQVLVRNSNIWFTQVLFDFLKRFQAEIEFCPKTFCILIEQVCKSYNILGLKNSIVNNGFFNFHSSVFDVLLCHYNLSNSIAILNVICKFKSSKLQSILEDSITTFTIEKLPVIQQLCVNLVPSNTALLKDHLANNLTNLYAIKIIKSLDLNGFELESNLYHPNQEIRMETLNIFNKDTMYQLMLECESVKDLQVNQRKKFNLLSQIVLQYPNKIVFHWLLSQFHIPFKPLWEFIIKLKITHKNLFYCWCTQFYSLSPPILPTDPEKKQYLNFWKNMKLIFPKISFYSTVDEQDVLYNRSTQLQELQLYFLKMANACNFGKYLDSDWKEKLWHDKDLNVLFNSNINPQLTHEVILLTGHQDSILLLKHPYPLLQLTSFQVSSTLNSDNNALIQRLIDDKSFKDQLLAFTCDIDSISSLLDYIIPILHGKIIHNKQFRSCISTFLGLLNENQMNSFLELCFSQTTFEVNQQHGMMSMMLYLLEAVPYNCKPFKSLFIEVLMKMNVKDKTIRSKVLQCYYKLACLLPEADILDLFFKILPERIVLIPMESIEEPSLILLGFQLACENSLDIFKSLLPASVVSEMIHSKYCKSSQSVAFQLAKWLDISLLNQLVTCPLSFIEYHLQSVLYYNPNWEIVSQWISQSNQPLLYSDYIKTIPVHLEDAFMLLKCPESFKIDCLLQFAKSCPELQEFINLCYKTTMNGINMESRYKAFELKISTSTTNVFLFILLDCLESDESNLRYLVLNQLSSIIDKCSPVLLEHIYVKCKALLKSEDVLIRFDIFQFMMKTAIPEFEQLQQFPIHSLFNLQAQDRKEALAKLLTHLTTPTNCQILLDYIYPTLVPHIQNPTISQICTLILQNSASKAIIRYQFMKNKLIPNNNHLMIEMLIKVQQPQWLLQQVVSHKAWFSKDVQQIKSVLKTCLLISPYYSDLKPLLFKSINCMQIHHSCRLLIYRLVAQIINKHLNLLGYVHHLIQQQCSGLWVHVYRVFMHTILVHLDLKVGQIDYLIMELYDSLQDNKDKLIKELKKSLPEIQQSTSPSLALIIGSVCSADMCTTLLDAPTHSKQVMSSLFDGLFQNQFTRAVIIEQHHTLILKWLNNKQFIQLECLLIFTKKALPLKIPISHLVDSLGSCLDSNSDAVVIATLRCMSLCMPLFDNCIKLIYKRIIYLLSRQVQQEMQIALLKCLSLINVQSDHVDVILNNIEPYFNHLELHKQSLSIYKQLIKSSSPLLYDYLKQMMTLSITSELSVIREAMQHSILFALQHLPMTAKKQTDILNYFLGNLNYATTSGQKSAIDTISKIHKYIPLSLNTFLQLSLCLGNESLLKEDIKSCITHLVPLINQDLKREYCVLIIEWLNKYNCQSLGLELCTISLLLDELVLLYDFKSLFTMRTNVVHVAKALESHSIAFEGISSYVVEMIELNQELDYPELYKLLIIHNDITDYKQMGMSLLYRFQKGNQEEFNLIIKLLQYISQHVDQDTILFMSSKLVHAAYKGSEYKLKLMLEFMGWLVLQNKLELHEYCKIVIRCEDDTTINQYEGVLSKISQMREKLISKNYLQVYGQVKANRIQYRQEKKQEKQQLAISNPQLKMQMKIKKNLKKALKRKIENEQFKAKRTRYQ